MIPGSRRASELAEEDHAIRQEWARLQVRRDEILDELAELDGERERLVDRRLRWRRATEARGSGPGGR